MTDADEQLMYLRRAALTVGGWLEAHPELSSPAYADNPVGYLAAKADHLAGCAAAVDDLCCRARQHSDLPSDWQPRADPRVTANGAQRRRQAGTSPPGRRAPTGLSTGAAAA